MVRLSWFGQFGVHSWVPRVPPAQHRAAGVMLAACLVAGCGGDSDDLGTVRNRDDSPSNGPNSSELLGDGGARPNAGASPSSPGASPSDDAPAESDAAPTESPVVNEDDQILLDESQLGDPDEFECERLVSLATVPLSAPPPFDVIIVADHSDSLSWSKAELSAGLSSLLDNVVGHEVRFFVLTPTQYGESSAPAVDRYSGEALVTWRDPVTGDPYQNAMTRYVERCIAPTGERIACPAIGDLETVHQYEGSWEFVMPDPIAVVTADMTSSEVAEQQRRIAEHIDALGGGASQLEQPVCTLNRYIRQPREALPEHAVFLVISDEDDVSEPSDCVGEYNYQTQTVTGTWSEEGCEVDCDGRRFSASLPQASRYMSFQCVPVDDLGQTFPEQATWHGQVLAMQDACVEAQAVCTNGQHAAAQEECGPGSTVATCETDCYEGSRDKLCAFESADVTLDACTQPFESDGQSYANMADYCAARYGGAGWQACESVGLREVPFNSSSGGGHVSSLVNSAGDLLGMIREFQLEADRHFGEDGYHVAAITHDAAFDCELAVGQSYAETLRMITDGPSHVFPICGSYAPALSEFDEFAHELLQTEYPLVLGADESIESVAVVDRDGAMQPLATSDYSYDAANAMLTLAQGVLSAKFARLEVKLVDPCVPRVR